MIPEIVNIFNNLSISDKTEKIFEIFKHKNIRIEKIVSNNSSSPEDFWYDQEEDEWFVLIEGSATIEFKDRLVELTKGDSYFIQKKELHRVVSTNVKTLWLVIFIN